MKAHIGNVVTGVTSVTATAPFSNSVRKSLVSDHIFKGYLCAMVCYDLGQLVKYTVIF